LLAVAWGAGAAATLWWTWLAAAASWRQAVAGALCLAAGAGGLAAWRRSPSGSIVWDGTGWTLAGHDGSAASGRIEPGADLQWVLLARWQPESGPAAWLWLERRQAPHAWDALRRAVYSRARTEAPQGSAP
jgi:hypothetical protein